ncbi:albusnodin family lasso peptide [Lentzea tibetensis]|uniref:Albusnodin family lasso peptide n=1 Tax=Lentzea tibetensis TaxID=2591470 RepID=A0A563EEP5_9PSEU|nr:albusnodin family lasso peptide [Lentzea tibetensis]TWP43536.1 albusnodin family lasso peptide [Lentzea tibetensis]
MNLTGQIQMVAAPDDDPELMVELGDVADLTLGGPGEGRENKRREVG